MQHNNIFTNQSRHIAHFPCGVVNICFSKSLNTGSKFNPPSIQRDITRQRRVCFPFILPQRERQRQTDSELCVCKMIVWYSVGGDGQMGHLSTP